MYWILRFIWTKYCSDDAGAITLDFLSELSSFYLGFSEGSEDRDPMTEQKKFLREYGYAYTSELDLILMQLIDSDVLNMPRLQKEYDKFAKDISGKQMTNKFREVWKKYYHGTLRNNEAEFCDALVNITIPSSVTSIGVSAFHNSDALVNIIIPSSVTYIGGSAFSDCDSLAGIIIPSGLTDISGSTFYLCSGLISVVIPSSVDHIGLYAFAGCTSLIDITVYAVDPPYLAGSSCFVNINDNVVIKVPSGSLTAYQNASYWKNFASKMVGF